MKCQHVSEMLARRWNSEMTDTMDLDRRTRRPSGGDDAQPDRRRTARHRLVVELSPDLHRRILTICGTRRIPVNQAVREVLERAFPG